MEKKKTPVLANRGFLCGSAGIGMWMEGLLVVSRYVDNPFSVYYLGFSMGFCWVMNGFSVLNVLVSIVKSIFQTVYCVCAGVCIVICFVAISEQIVVEDGFVFIPCFLVGYSDGLGDVFPVSFLRHPSFSFLSRLARCRVAVCRS